MWRKSLLAIWRNSQKIAPSEREHPRLPRRSMLLKVWFNRFSGSVNMQVVMRVNAEQASKRLTQKPTRPKDGEGRS
jgi:hypothetical protein